MSEPGLIVGDDVAVRLPRSYDPDRLVRDLEAVKHISLAAQPGPYHNGEWRGIALHAQGGRQSAHPGYAGLDGYAPTEALDHAPYLAEILAGIPSPKRVVRLLTLPPGVEIEEHTDAWANWQCGTLRLHAPIVTHPDVVFMIDGERIEMPVGELWWGDFSRPHSVLNESPITRVHMVIDLEIDAFALDLFPADFVARRRAEGEGIAMHADPIPTTADALAAYACAFRMPSEVMPLFGAGRKLTELTAGARGALRVDGDRLLALLDDRPAFALRPTGDGVFGVVGQTSGVTVEIAREGGRVSAMHLVLKGLPEDLYAAQLGFQQGPLVAKRRVPFPLV